MFIYKKKIITIILFLIIFFLILNLDLFNILEGNNEDSIKISKNQKKILEETTLTEEEIMAKEDPSTIRNRFT